MLTVVDQLLELYGGEQLEQLKAVRGKLVAEPNFLDNHRNKGKDNGAEESSGQKPTNLGLGSLRGAANSTTRTRRIDSYLEDATGEKPKAKPKPKKK